MFDIYQRIYQLLFALWRRRYLIVTCLIVAPIISLTIAILTPKSYKISTTILIHEPNLLNPYLQDRTIAIKLKQRMESLKAGLSSHQVLAQMAKSLGLVKAEMPLKEKISIYSDMAKRLNLVERGGGVIELNYLAPTQYRIKDAMNKISTVFIKNILLPQPKTLDGSEKFLQEQLTKNKQELLDAEQKMSEFVTKNSDSLPAVYSRNVNRFNQIKENLVTKKKELMAVEEQLKKYQQQLIPLSPPLAELEKKITQRQFQLALYHNDTSIEKHIIKDKLAELNLLLLQREQLLKDAAQVNLAELQAVRGNAGLVLSRNRQQPQGLSQSLLLTQLGLVQETYIQQKKIIDEINSLKERANMLEPSIQAYGNIDRQRRALQQKVDDKRIIYQRMLQSYKNTQEMRDLGQYTAAGRVQIVDAPDLLGKPVSYGKKLFLLMGLLAGIMFGIGMSLVLEFLDTSIRYRDQLEKTLGIPVLIRLPKL